MADLTLADIQAPDGSPVPRDWTAALTHLAAAQVARESMRNFLATPEMRDDATVRFSREIEAMFEAMGRPRDSGTTGVITNLLCKRGRK